MSEDKTAAETPSGSRISRRTLVRGAAWTAPVVMVAAPSPAMAASPVKCCATVTMDAAYSGNAPAWTFFFNVDARGCPTDVRISSVQVYINGSLIYSATPNATTSAGQLEPNAYDTGKVTITLFGTQAQNRCHYYGAGRVNEVQRITITDQAPPGGTFTLTFGGQTTAPITYPATAAQVQAALESLSSIGPGNVSVTGNPGGPYDVTFQGALAGTNVAQMTGTGTGVSVSVSTVTGGSPTCNAPPCVAVQTPWTAQPCQQLLTDTAFARVTFQSRVGTTNTWVACGDTYVTAPFTSASKCGVTAGCS